MFNVNIRLQAIITQLYIYKTVGGLILYENIIKMQVIWFIIGNNKTEHLKSKLLSWNMTKLFANNSEWECCYNGIF